MSIYVDPRVHIKLDLISMPRSYSLWNSCDWSPHLCITVWTDMGLKHHRSHQLLYQTVIMISVMQCITNSAVFTAALILKMHHICSTWKADKSDTKYTNHVMLLLILQNLHPHKVEHWLYSVTLCRLPQFTACIMLHTFHFSDAQMTMDHHNYSWKVNISISIE
jgi:hypothetical protein